MKKQIPFGVTFYPDQWPKGIWDESYRMIKDAGFNVVRFGEMAWDWVQPGEKTFKWAEMDTALRLADKYGIKVILGIASSQAPTWLLRKYPEVRPVSNTGSLYPEYGPRPNVCRDSDVYKRLVENYIRHLITRYKNHTAVFAWQVDNEPVYPPLDSTTHEDFCHCSATQRKFLLWVKNRYKSLKNLNYIWGTRFWTNRFSSWEDITTPKCGVWDAGNPHIFMDWYRFKSEMIHNWLLWEKSLIDKLDGKHKVGTNGFLEICPRMLDHDLLAGGMDWYGWDVYPKGRKSTPGEIAHTSDWWRSFGNGRETRFYVTELQAGPNVRWGNPAYVKGTDVKLWTHQMIAHGAKALLYHNWRTPVFGGEAGGFGILNPDGSPTERLSAIKDAGSEIRDIYSRLEGYKLKAEYAIAYLRDSDVQTFQEQGPPRIISGQWEQLRENIGLRHSMRSVEGAHKILWNNYNPVDFIFQRQLEEACNFNQYKAIFLPNPYIFAENWWVSLKKYLEQGGILITESRFGVKTPMGWLYERPLMEKFLGLRRRHHELIEEGAEPLIKQINARAYGFKDVVETKNKIIARFKDNSPALIEIKVGKGKIIYACFSLFLSCLKQGNGGLIKIVRRYLPKPLFNPAIGTEAVQWKKGKNSLVYLINYSGKTKQIRVKTKSIQLNPYQAKLVKTAGSQSISQ